MALIPRVRVRNGALANIQQLFRNPEVRRAVVDLARRAGNHLGQRIREFQEDDYDHGDDEEEMVQDNKVTSTNNNNNTTDMAVSSAPSAGIGFRGPLHGNTQLHRGYAEHYHEIHELHSRKVRSIMFTWGFSKFGYESTTQLTGTSVPGYVLLKQQYSNSDVFEPWGDLSKPVGFDNQIYSQALNFQVDDFVDNKLHTGNDPDDQGLMSQYEYVRLKHFEVEIVPHTYIGSIFNEQPLVWANQTNCTTPPIPGPSSNPNMVPHNDTKYWFLRDTHNDFTTSTNPDDIPAVPLEAQTGTRDPYDRRVSSIRNFDNYLTLVNNHESFKFRREVMPKANYNIPVDNIDGIRATNIGVVVNALEGITPTTGITEPMPESFNLLIAPSAAPIRFSSPTTLTLPVAGNFVVPYCEIITKLYIKYTATWEAFNFNYRHTNGPQQLKKKRMDPMNYQQFMANAHESILQQKLTRGSL